MTELLEKAREWVGRQAMPSVTARDPVNVPMIRRWCEAMGDTNPIYVDEDAAKAAGHPGIVAPPAMLEVWTMMPYKPGGRTPEDGMDVLNMFDDAGYTGVVATNNGQRYKRYLRPGDVVTATTTVADVSDEKRTGLGIGHFVTLSYEFTVDGETVGTMTFRILKFKPHLKQSEPKQDSGGGGFEFSHPRPAITHDNAFFWEGIDNHKLLFQSTEGRLRHPPSPMDPVSGSLEFDIVEAKGTGKIHSFVVMHQPQLPTLEYPLPIALVELDEGVRMIAHVVGSKAEDVAIGAPVQVEFIEIEPEYTIPAFRLTEGD